MTINYQRRDFLRRACYVGLSVGLPKPVLAMVEGEVTSEGLLHIFERKMAEMEAGMRAALSSSSPSFILAGDSFMEVYGQELIDAGYTHEVLGYEHEVVSDD